MNEDEKKAWQAEQEALDSALAKQREQDEKRRARDARKTKRKMERLKRELSKSGDLTDWEDEFTGSVTERLEKYDSAFADPQKGRSDKALSYAQKAIVSQLSKKARKVKRGETNEDEPKGFKPRSSFKSKRPKFTPRVRQLDEDFEDEAAAPEVSPKPSPDASRGVSPKRASDPPSEPPLKGKPFLRIVKNDGE